jgi:hypothetical protein
MRQELNEKVGRRDLLNMRIMHLEKNIKGLRALLIQERLTSLREKQGQTLVIGITEAIRTVMRAEKKPMTAAEVKTRLTEEGFDLERFRNSAAVIHNTMARMAKADELKIDRRTKRYCFPETEE